MDITYSAFNEEIEKIIRSYDAQKEQALAAIIARYDFIVGSTECKQKLTAILPEGANVVCSPYIEDPTMIYAIKKFDISDFVGISRKEG